MHHDFNIVVPLRVSLLIFHAGGWIGRGGFVKAVLSSISRAILNLIANLNSIKSIIFNLNLLIFVIR
jgi:hypothetical protein